MSIEIDGIKCVTLRDAAKTIGTTVRGMYRIAERAAEDGHECVFKRLNRALVPVDMIPTMKLYYFPCGSEARSEKSKEWGATGGFTKAANQRRAARHQKTT